MAKQAAKSCECQGVHDYGVLPTGTRREGGAQE